MSMDVLALQGSPRVIGNTQVLLDAFLNSLPSEARIHKYNVFQLNVRPCISCYACQTLGHCPIDDDMKLIYPKLAKYPLIVVASPIYFYGFPAQLKALIDRCQTFWTNPSARSSNRNSILLLTAGAPDTSGVGRQTVANSARIFFECIGAPLAHALIAVGTDTHPTAAQTEILAQAKALAATYKL